MSLSAKQNAFAVAVVTNGGDKVAAYKTAGYSQKMSSAAIAVESDKLFNHPKISLKIAELQKEADKVAKERFSISVEQRLEWLREVAEAGLNKQLRPIGESFIEQRENLAATNKAIEIMNSMLGIDNEDETGEEISITFNVSQPVKDVKVTRGE